MDILARLNTEAFALRTRMETLSRQMASGRVSDRLGDLGTQAPRAVSLANDMGRREVYGRAMDQALGRMSVTQTTLGRLQTIASEFRADLAIRLDANDPNALVTVQARARAAVQEVASLLNTRLNGEYLFGGSDLANPPVPDAAQVMSSPMATGIAGAIAGLTNGNASAVAAATLAAAQDSAAGASPFSAYLEDPAQGGTEPRRSVPAGDGEVVGYGIAANRNAAATSSGETTGSWARDLLRGLMSLAALTPAQATQTNGFDALAGVIRNGLAAAESALAEEQGALGAVQQRVEEGVTRHKAINTALTTQLAGITDVDLAETLTRLQSTRTTLEASYRATANLGELTLSRFLH